MKKKKVRRLLLMVCLVVIMINIVSILKKKDVLCYEAGVKVAKPIIVLKKDDVLKTEIKENSFPMEYHFWIQNYEEDEINGVDFEYSITLENSVENFPVSYCLVDCDNNREMQLVDGKSENLKLKKDSKEDREFKLVLQWKELNVELADEWQVKLKVNMVQEVKDEV